MKIFFSLLLIVGSFTTTKFYGITWGTPQSISGTDASAARISYAGTNNALAAWTRFDGSNQIIEGALYSGSWDTPQALSASGFDASFQAISKRASTAAAIWQLHDGTNFVIQASTYSGGTWTMQTLSDSGFDAYEPRISMNSSGDAIAIWTQSTNSFDVIKVAHFTSGSWGSSQVISDTGLQSSTARLAFNASGKALAVWMVYDPNTDLFSINGATYTGSWGSIQSISTSGTTTFFPRVVLNSSGVGAAVWESDNMSTAFDVVNASLFNGTSWGSETTISNTSENASDPEMAMNDNGTIVVGWEASNGSSEVAAAIYSGSWGSPEVVSTDTLASGVRVGIDGSDNAIAVWSAIGLSNVIVRASEYSGSWDVSPTTISANGDDGFNPVISMISAGDAFVAWDGFDGTDFTVVAVPGTP